MKCKVKPLLRSNTNSKQIAKSQVPDSDVSDVESDRDEPVKYIVVSSDSSSREGVMEQPQQEKKDGMLEIVKKKIGGGLSTALEDAQV